MPFYEVVEKHPHASIYTTHLVQASTAESAAESPHDLPALGRIQAIDCGSEREIVSVRELDHLPVSLNPHALQGELVKVELYCLHVDGTWAAGLFVYVEAGVGTLDDIHSLARSFYLSRMTREELCFMVDVQVYHSVPVETPAEDTN